MQAPTVLHLLLWAALTIWIGKELLPSPASVPWSGITLTPEAPGSSAVKLTIVDFASHFNFVKKAWLGETTANRGASIYSLENHLKVTSDWAGIRLGNALPFGYSPTMLWVLAPLVCFPYLLAQVLFGVAGLFSIWWTTHPARCRLGIGLLAFFSPLARACFALGQTALLTGAALLFLAQTSRGGNRAQGWRAPALSAVALWALSAKPPIALTAAAVLVGLRQWRPLLLAGILVLLSSLALSPILGVNWAHDYLQMIGTYDRVNADTAYAWSLVPGHMANLRGILNVDFGVADNIASRISSVIWIIALLYLAMAGSRRGLPEWSIWSFGILSFLSFCPHVSSTEELQLVLLLPFCVPPQGRLRWQEWALLVTVSLFAFASPAIGPLAGNRMILFAVKMLLAIGIFTLKTREETDFQHLAS